MDQVRQLFFGLSLRQRIVIGVAALGVVLSVWLGLRWNRERDLKPLFTSLSAEDAGVLVERLRSSKVDFKVGDNGTILVPSSQVPELRLEMAASGLPKTGRIGFEIFDKANFGLTEFAEQINYRRAIEGELERSVMAVAEVERARVHVTFPKESVFTDEQRPAKASVMVKLRPGASLSPQNILGITHLTASAVEGLAPEAVSVIDMSGKLLNRPKRDSGPDELGASDAMIEYRQALERDVQNKIRSTLDPLLGEDRYRAGVSIDCDFSSGEQSEEIFDPDRSVMLSSQKTEDVSGGAASAGGGVPGTASNLPRPAPRTVAGGAGVARRTENIAYQTSRVVKRTNIPRGSVKRLSVSVLVDQEGKWEGSGANARRVLVPPSPEKLKVVRDVLAGVVGFQQERGDQILVETLPFEATITATPPEPAAPAPVPGAIVLPEWARQYYEKAPPLVWLGAFGAVMVILVAGVYLLIRRGRKPVPRAEVTTGARAIPPQERQEDFQQKALAALAENQAELERKEQEVLSTLRLPPSTSKAEILKKHISEQAKQDPVATAHLIRTWLGEPGR